MIIKYSEEEIMSGVLNRRFPHGNVTFLLEHCFLQPGGEINIRLPTGHWAFTQISEPERFYRECEVVYDRGADSLRRLVANFERQDEAEHYVKLRNKKEVWPI